MVGRSQRRVGARYSFTTQAMIGLAGLVGLCAAAAPACAANATPTTAPADQSADSGSTRYGPWNLLDRRSDYGVGVFPEPFLVDDSDAEQNEARFDWFHSENHGLQDNPMVLEVEHGFGLVTVEVEAHYDYTTTSSFDSATGRATSDLEQGFQDVDLGARAPVFQYVSPDEFFDTTFGFGIEVGVPTNTPISKATEIVPKFFNDTRLGDHITIQSIVGYSILLGPGADGGDERTFEYGMVLGYTIPHDELPIPDVEQFIPVFELSGETAVNGDDPVGNTLLGNAAMRFNLQSIGRLQPRLGVGYVFPIDQGGRDTLRWGIYTSLVFEF
jgi:hypothetical protein